MIKRFILSLSFLFIFSSTLKATDLYFFDRLDAFVQEKLSARGYASTLYYSSSLRFSDRERIKNGRLVGNYNTWEPEFPVHFQAISFNNGNANFCPQDAISAIFQILFPCPGEIELQPNQTISDPITLASFKTLGVMLRHIEEGYMISNAAKREEALRNSLYHLLPLENSNEKASQFNVSPLNLEECLKNYDAFLVYDFKKNIALYLAKLLTGVSDEDLEDEGFTHNDPDKYTKALKVLGLDLFERGLLKDGELETYLYYWEAYNKFKTYKGRKLTLEQQSDLNKFNEVYKDHLVFEENKTRFKKVVFVETLIRALSQQQSDHRTYSYPAFFVQRALMTYFWMKAKNEGDVGEWFSGLLDVPSEELRPRIQSRFPLNMYEPWKTTVLKQSTESEQILLNSEKLALLSWGYHLFDAFLPPLIPYGTSRYKGQTFANCVETSCFNFLRFISRRKGGQGYHQDITVFPSASLAYKIFEHHSEPAQHFLREVHSAWAAMLSARKGLIYCKPGTAKREKRNYEIKAGIINILNCLTLSLADSPEEVSLLKFEDGEEAIEAAMVELEHRCTQEGFVMKIELENDPSKDETLKDYFGDILFTINGKKSFIWRISRMHSDIEVCDDEEHDWRKTVSTQHFLSTPLLKEMMPCFLNLDSIKEIFPRLSRSEQSAVCYGMDVRPLKTKLELIELIFRQQQRSLDSFANSLIASVLKLDDPHARNQLTSLLIPLSAGDHPVLTDEQMCSIISRHPRVMDGSLEANTPSSMNAIIWAYQNNKKHWIDLAASHITYINLESEKVDFEAFLGTFSQLKNLEHLSFSTIAKLPVFYTILPILKSLESIGISFDGSSTNLSSVITMVDYLPTKFESLRLNGPLEEEEFRKLIQVFFTKVSKGNLNLFFWNKYTNVQQEDLAKVKERLQEFAENLGISQERLSLNYPVPNIS